MGEMDLFHDEKRDEFFFWESEKPFKYIGKILARNGLESHEMAQRWLMELVKPYEAKVQSREPVQSSEKSVKQFNGSVYEKLLLYKNPKTGNPLDWTERASEIMDHAVAGQDAVPAALEFIFRQVSTHTDVQSKMRLELLTSMPLSAEDRTFAMIDSLSYVNAVVMEGLRLVNTISSYQTRVVPKGGCVVADHYLPAGTIVAAQPYLINRQPDIFPNPNTFDPSRWLLLGEEYRNLSKSMWTYSSGPRSCLGRELSSAIIKTVLVDTYTRYKTTLLEPDRTEKRPWEGADFMAEVRFENILGCEEGKRIEKRVRKTSLSPVEAQEQIQEPV
ncbi:hypothetical protein ABVK25_000837 [Lepraria finkii]|uniref:Cytochrome P450 n=1 Tax=Lepraria finkii TaxID=1340010 RepID=A0ABR4BP08_9LECA